MEIIIIMLIVFFIVSRLTPKPGELGGAQEKLIVEKKKCPPHQWFWQEIVDQDGNKQGERICCRICGPMRSREEHES